MKFYQLRASAIVVLGLASPAAAAEFLTPNEIKAQSRPACHLRLRQLVARKRN